MPSTDKKTDETELKKDYKQFIRGYLNSSWPGDKVDEFIDALFNGIYVPTILDRYASSEFVRVISRIHKKWLFSRMPVRNENNTMIIGWKYFPNPRVVRYKKKTTEKSQEQYQKL